MRCIYCEKPCITVFGKGPAHRYCHEAFELNRRVFKDLDISSLSDKELINQKDLGLSEENARQNKDSKIVELF